ncbi:MAG: hypothetical protein EBZ93_12815, partial [Actinobacteria bacterium]|nr:hypothetical protein [Actinomycetota bacterium]
GSVQGVIFSNWTQVDEINYTTSKLVALGLDWGYTNDPTALVAVYRSGDTLTLHELLYANNLTNQDIATKLREFGINRAWEIVADSAEPKSIEEVHRLGFNIKAAQKGQDSIRNSIDILHRFNIQVTKTSTNLIKDYDTPNSNYRGECHAWQELPRLGIRAHPHRCNDWRQLHHWRGRTHRLQRHHWRQLQNPKPRAHISRRHH